MHVRLHHAKNFDRKLTIISHTHDFLHNRISGINTCNCQSIEKVIFYKYLGLIEDQRVSKKLRVVLAKYSTLKYKIPFPILMNLYNTLAEFMSVYY